MNPHKSAPLKNSENRTLFEDPIVKEVRDTRHKLASQNGRNSSSGGICRNRTKLGSPNSLGWTCLKYSPCFVLIRNAGIRKAGCGYAARCFGERECTQREWSK